MGAEVTCEEGDPVTILPNFVYLIPRGTTFRGGSTVALRHGYFHFHTSWRADPGIYRIPTTGKLGEAVDFFLRSDHFRIDSPETVFTAYFMLCQIFQRFGNGHFRFDPNESRLLPALSYMQNHLHRKLSTDNLARISGMSVNHFIRIFKEVYGLTPYRYLTLQRCEQVAIRLEQSELSIEQIAEETGFCDRYHLTKVFRKIRGLSPAAYRRSLRGRKEDKPISAAIVA